MPNPPFGNIYEVNTPALDKLGDRLYAEQRQREQYQLQQNRMLDDEFSRNLSGIRDSDIGDLTKAYGEFKLSYQGLMKRRGGGTPQEQLEVLRKKASIYDVLNQSKQEKAWEDLQQKQGVINKGRIYADDWQRQLYQRRQTPVSKLDRTKDADLLYKYSVPDLAKEIKTAEGTEREVPITIGVSKVDPLKDDKEIYKVKNNPSVFAGKLLEQIVSGNKTRNFVGIMDNKYDEQELEDLKNKYYAKVNDPKFISVYGKVDQLPAQDTDLGRAVAIRTMEEFANVDLKPTRLISELNQDRSRTRSEEFRIKMADKLQQFKRENIAAVNWYRQQDKQSQDFFIDSIIDDNLIEAQRNNGEFEPSPLVANSLSTGTGVHRQQAGKMRTLADGNFEYLISGKWVPISANTYKAHLRDIFTAKAGAGQVDKSGETKKPQGKTMAAADYRKLSLTERQAFINSGGKVQ